MKKVLFQSIALSVWSALTAVGWNHFSPWRIPLRQGGAFDIAAARGEWRRISTLEAKQLYDGGATIFVDARPRGDYEQGTVQGAFSLPADAFDTWYPNFEMQVPPMGVDHVIFCSGGTCTDSVQVANQLKDRGWERLWVMEDGYDAWLKAGYPVEAPP